MLVKDVPKHFKLVTDSQDIDGVADYLGANLDDYGCLFVEVFDGEIGEVYGCYSNVPYLMDTAFLLRG